MCLPSIVLEKPLFKNADHINLSITVILLIKKSKNMRYQHSGAIANLVVGIPKGVSVIRCIPDIYRRINCNISYKSESRIVHQLRSRWVELIFNFYPAELRVLFYLI